MVRSRPTARFDVSGPTVDAPTEPEERQASFRTKEPLHSYPVREAGTVVCAYPGNDEPPACPDFEFARRPEDHVFIRGHGEGSSPATVGASSHSRA